MIININDRYSNYTEILLDNFSLFDKITVKKLEIILDVNKKNYIKILTYSTKEDVSVLLKNLSDGEKEIFKDVTFEYIEY